ncbi:putative RNA-binding protein Luc7-like 2 isoform X3 [Tachypleus tridentatus]|uniref:putative RNA-binding protein Luc7-like 2 isoform X3 n=1 Tax=Tachypleus tridentatus TaxID=6853 RepID=UPI003FD590E5
MALASAKALLDELMGRDRNLPPTESKRDSQWNKDASWNNPEVCKYFLVKFCPNELFVNTKADLGICSKIHDERIRKEYEQSDRFQKMGYEDDFIKFCQGMLSDVERRIQRARKRLALGHQESGVASMPLSKNSEEKIVVLTDRINELLIQVEELGCEGKVEEAQGIMKLVDQLKEERETLRKGSEPSHWLQQTAEIAAAQEKQMEVCEVCGAFLIVGDAQQRVDDHLMGKQHVGYARLKSAVEEILVSMTSWNNKLNQQQRVKEREDRENQIEKERLERRRRQEEEERKREKEREERRRTLEEEEEERRWKEKERERYRHRSRSLDRGRRRSCERRSRSRDHRHSRSSKEKSKHERANKERSKQRSRSRSRESRHSRRSHSRSREKKNDSKHQDKESKDKRKERSKDSDYHRNSKDGCERSRSGGDDTGKNGDTDMRVQDTDMRVPDTDLRFVADTDLRHLKDQ